MANQKVTVRDSMSLQYVLGVQLALLLGLHMRAEGAGIAGWTWSATGSGNYAFVPQSASQVDDLLLVGGSNAPGQGAFLAGYAVETGAKQWQLALAPVANAHVLRSVPIEGGAYVAGTRSGYSFVARIRASGETAWVSDLVCHLQGTTYCPEPDIAATPNGVLVSTAGHIHELSALDGTAVDRWPAPGVSPGISQSRAKFAVAPDGSIFLLNELQDNRAWLSALRLTTGASTWSFPFLLPAGQPPRAAMGIALLPDGSIVAAARGVGPAQTATRYTIAVIEPQSGAEQWRTTYDVEPAVTSARADGICLSGDTLLTWSLSDNITAGVLVAHSLSSRSLAWSRSVPITRAMSCGGDVITTAGEVPGTSPARGVVQRWALDSGDLLWRTEMSGLGPRDRWGLHDLGSEGVVVFDRLQTSTNTFTSRVRRFTRTGLELEPLDLRLRSSVVGTAVAESGQRILAAATSVMEGGLRIQQASIDSRTGTEDWVAEHSLDQPSIVFSPTLFLDTRAGYVAAIVNAEGQPTQTGTPRMARLLHRDTGSGILRFVYSSGFYSGPFANPRVAADGSVYFQTAGLPSSIQRRSVTGAGIWVREYPPQNGRLHATSAGVVATGSSPLTAYGFATGVPSWTVSSGSGVGDVSTNGSEITLVMPASPLRVQRRDAATGNVSGQVDLQIAGINAYANALRVLETGPTIVAGHGDLYYSTTFGWIAKLDESMVNLEWLTRFTLPSRDGVRVTSMHEAANGDILATVRPFKPLLPIGGGEARCRLCPEYLLRIDGATGAILSWHHLGSFGLLHAAEQAGEFEIIRYGGDHWIMAAQQWLRDTPLGLSVRRSPVPDFSIGALEIDSSSTASYRSGDIWLIESDVTVHYVGTRTADRVVVETDFGPDIGMASSVVIADCVVSGGGQCGAGRSAGQARQVLALEPGATATIRFVTAAPLGEASPPMRVFAHLPLEIGTQSAPVPHEIELPQPPPNLILADSFE